MYNSLKIAKNCRHYAMCKIDFLGTGICSSGPERHYVSFYPQGRMILYEGLAENKIPITPAAKEIADSCDLCGKCDYQCYFITEMQPVRVMKALKERIRNFSANGGKVDIPDEDNILREIREISGKKWASNDPAILYTYCHDLSPVSTPQMPSYVVLPNSKEEIADLVKLFRKHNLRYTVRGNGANLLGFSVSEGVIIDLNRMKTIEFNEKKWYVKAGPGVTAFELQREAKKRGFRINAGEPAAMICSNIMGSGVMSSFSTTYGINADNYTDAEFVSGDGNIFRLNDTNSPNLYAYKDLNHPGSPGICVSANIRLHPVTEDENGVLVPFGSLEEAVNFTRECAIRHIGIAISLIGPEYISTFLAPTIKMAAEVKKIFTGKLDIPYLVLIIGDRYAINSIREMGYPFFDQRMLDILYLGLPALKSARWLGLVKQMTEDEPYAYLKIDHFADLAETALSPSPELLAEEVDDHLKEFYKRLYKKPEMTDMVWLTMFRILSTRVGRRKPFLPVLVYLPMDFELISELTAKYAVIAGHHQVEHEFGFITPIDNGKRCIYEYDYFFDYNDEEEIRRIRAAAQEANHLIDEYAMNDGIVRGHPYVLHQGFSRKENLLYS